MVGKKVRLDQLLVDRGFVENRSKAQSIIMAGKVFSDNFRLEKSGKQVAKDLPIEIRGMKHQWVSRGGLKLAHGINFFGINPEGLTCLDVGSSTGGFTDVLLQYGAKKVYAVDVGRAQLAWKLRQDARVIVMEGTNARHLGPQDISELIDLIVCDASFIGLQTLLPSILKLASSSAQLIALIKPQFEVGKEKVGKKGIVHDPVQHSEVCKKIECWLELQPGWSVSGITKSPIKGLRGNQEFLIGGQRN